MRNMSDRDVTPDNTSVLPTDRLVEIVAMFHVMEEALIELASAFTGPPTARMCCRCAMGVEFGCDKKCPGLLARRALGVA